MIKVRVGYTPILEQEWPRKGLMGAVSESELFLEFPYKTQKAHLSMQVRASVYVVFVELSFLMPVCMNVL